MVYADLVGPEPVALVGGMGEESEEECVEGFGDGEVRCGSCAVQGGDNDLAGVCG